jgi:uncharacterized protein (TIGR03437 family)
MTESCVHAVRRMIARTLLLLSVFSVGLYADASGPDPGLSGVPGEVGNCTNCHGAGASSVNKNGGSVSIAFPKGQSYIPGEVQHWIVTVTDSSARRWGFQAAARKASATSTLAGGFKSSDANTQVICSNTSFNRAQATTTGACTSSFPLMYVEHTATGTRLGTTGSITFEFDWTAPATDIGAVTVYIAANAANGNNQDDSGDHIYTASYTLQPSVNTGPVISSNGIVNGASFTQGIEAGSWVSIQGQNLSTTTRTWTSSDFNNGTPTSLDGVSVSIGGKPAYVYYISPTQINVLAPDVPAGATSVTVTNASGTSSAVTATVADYSPGLFLTGKYAIATHQDGTLVAPAGLYGNSSPAAAGETVILWGTGFGPVSPAVPSGQTSTQALGGSTIAYASLPPSIMIGGVPATVVAAALNPSALGLYQIAVTIPKAAASGDQTLVASVGGTTSPTSGVLLTIQ